MDARKNGSAPTAATGSALNISPAPSQSLLVRIGGVIETNALSCGRIESCQPQARQTGRRRRPHLEVAAEEPGDLVARLDDGSALLRSHAQVCPLAHLIQADVLLVRLDRIRLQVGRQSRSSRHGSAGSRSQHQARRALSPQPGRFRGPSATTP